MNKNNKLRIKITSFWLLASSILLFNVGSCSHETKNKKLDDVVDVDTIKVIDSVKIIDSSSIKEFDYVFNKFKIYNRNIDTNTVKQFILVCNAYKLNKTKELLDLCIGQILLESGAKHFKNGDNELGLIKSNVGAIGITQIMPKTAKYNLTEVINDKDKELFYKLGSSKFSKTDNLETTTSWVSDETNNLILWGYIMRYNLNRRPNILKVLISYNAGTTGMLNYVKRGGNINSHDYVTGILSTLNYTKKH